MDDAVAALYTGDAVVTWRRELEVLFEVIDRDNGRHVWREGVFGEQVRKHFDRVVLGTPLWVGQPSKPKTTPQGTQRQWQEWDTACDRLGDMLRYCNQPIRSGITREKKIAGLRQVAMLMSSTQRRIDSWQSFGQWAASRCYSMRAGLRPDIHDPGAESLDSRGLIPLRKRASYDVGLFRRRRVWLDNETEPAWSAHSQEHGWILRDPYRKRYGNDAEGWGSVVVTPDGSLHVADDNGLLEHRCRSGRVEKASNSVSRVILLNIANWYAV
ncbi:hypothetical protein [Geodermatophilus sabuli]|nr:hypothetical protein [Geodermatophilus sabuli]